MGFSTPALDTPSSETRSPRPAREKASPRGARTVLASPEVETGGSPSGWTPRGRISPERRRVLGMLKNSPLAYVAMIVLGVIVLGAIFAPLLSPYDKDEINLVDQYLAPSLEHPFGTDDLGRDIFVRVMHGGRVSLFVGFLAMVVALLLGVLAGGVAGYYGGTIDTLIMRFVDLTLAIPVFFVILFLSSIVTPRLSIVAICIMIGATHWMEVARLVRSVVISTKEYEFVDAARVLGLADRRIIVRHLLPHTLAPVLVAITLGLAQAIIIESALSFLGFGVQPPTPSWGAMLQNAQGYLGTCPWIAIFPGVMIFLTVGCCNVLADFLGDAYTPVKPRTM